MLVGVISTEEHVKTLTKKLESEGFQLRLLGGDPTEIPKTVDVVVCRVASCSHGATSVALSEKRKKNGVPVIFENGTTAIMEALTKMKPAKKRRAARSVTGDLLHVGGVFSLRMLDKMSTQDVVQLWLDLGTIKTMNEREEAGGILRIAKSFHRESIRPHFRKLVTEASGHGNNYNLCELWSKSNQQSFHIPVLSIKPLSEEDKAKLAKALNAFVEKPEGIEVGTGGRRWIRMLDTKDISRPKTEVPVLTVGDFQACVGPSGSVHKDTDATRYDWNIYNKKDDFKVAIDKRRASISEMNRELKKREEAKPTPFDDFHEVLRMLKVEMEKLNVTSLSMENGKVTYVRRIVIIKTETLDL